MITRSAAPRGHTVPLDLLIGGEWVTTEERFPVLNPATGETIAEPTSGGVDEALRALAAAHAAQESWSGWSPRARADLMHRAHRLLLEREDAIVETMTLESGKPLAEARGEFALSASFFLWFAEQVAHLKGSYAEGSNGGYRVIVGHRPVGPSYLVTPWNFPLLMSARKAGAALGAGCTVVMKTARDTPLTQALFAEVLHDAGFPAGVVNLIHTRESGDVSRAIMADPRLRKVSFTGSTGVGATLLSQAAPGVVNSAMELGGDGPFIVLEDADIDLAVREAILCKFRNAGQACVAANRIILHEAIAEEFTQKFVAAAAELRAGDGFDPDTTVGPLISARQRDRVVSLLERLVQLGGSVLLGGSPRAGDGFFFDPTVVQFTQERHALSNEELFAPVAALYTVDSAAAALRLANDTPYGLAAYLFTRDISRAITLGERLEFGMVGLNRGIMADPAAPFGGTKTSGVGREAGHDGIYEFLEPHYMALSVDTEGAVA
ncbi:NAD-dependent succinate-semialdehyde dehydrogenase [Leucobacter chromiireducens]|uniref:NAD-dependent succinate-semialdehyde dehydrogenase n=1 Tax=Leucobacter chromiireducens subsp. solipictus TaxID=398235 RepID=A0ABS1SIK9_9MICO|nr:NAD-dependent succinate-semialdehyde dehydrogenase [Leucobacter chromiireducens]MBL3680397.1 NAD-dependent succinate-semialdehyde dehydrogenase [Leucobacter chromiireducens subsp. solipictus]